MTVVQYETWVQWWLKPLDTKHFNLAKWKAFPIKFRTEIADTAIKDFYRNKQ